MTEQSPNPSPIKHMWDKAEHRLQRHLRSLGGITGEAVVVLLHLSPKL